MLVLYNSTVCLYGTYLSLSEAMSCSVSAVFSAELEDISFSAARFSDATVASCDWMAASSDCVCGGERWIDVIYIAMRPYLLYEYVLYVDGKIGQEYIEPLRQLGLLGCCPCS